MQKNSIPVSSAESEIVIVVLKADSTGNIVDIQLLSDEKNRDKMYDILVKMTPAVFRGWRPANFSSRAIMIPVYGNSYYPTKKDNYADSAFGEMSFGGLGGKIIREDPQSVLLSGILYLHNGLPHKPDFNNKGTKTSILN